METARNMIAEPKPTEPPLPVVGNLELKLTEKNLQDLVNGEKIQIATFGGVVLTMSLDPAVGHAALTNMARNLPTFATRTELPARTEVTGDEVRL